MIRLKSLFFTLVMLVLASACHTDFLDIKRDKSEVIPKTIADFQGLLDGTNTMNGRSSHELGIIGGDELALTDEAWNALTNPYEKKGYIWAQNVYEEQSVNDWDRAYQRILLANTALEGAEAIDPKPGQMTQWKNLKGSALFYRAWNFYQLAQLFCKPYNAQTANEDLGIPLRLVSDITAKSVRASVEATYHQMIGDLEEAIELLPEEPLVFYRPAKPAAYAVLAKIYLQMGNYKKAQYYADLCLALKGELIDFKNLDLSATYPFPAFGEGNPEIILMSYMQNIAVISRARHNVNPDLIGIYDENDLRRIAYFAVSENSQTIFTGSYFGINTFFTGLTTSEMHLIRAECLARLGKTVEAWVALNVLLKHRYKLDSFNLDALPPPDNLLALIMEERRKELVLRGVRWEDLRRLNKDPGFAKTLVRHVNGQTYQLNPGDRRYVWPIPDNVINLSGIEQNPR